MKHSQFINTRANTRPKSKLSQCLVSIVLLCTLSACATTQTTVVVKAYTKEHDLFEERSKAITFYQNNQLAESLAIYDRLIASVPEDAELWFRKGNIHARINQPNEAVKAYQEAVLRDQKYYKAWRNMTTIQLRQAANSMTQLIAVLPPSHPLYPDSFALTKDIIKLISDKPQTVDAQSTQLEQASDE